MFKSFHHLLIDNKIYQELIQLFIKKEKQLIFSIITNHFIINLIFLKFSIKQ